MAPSSYLAPQTLRLPVLIFGSAGEDTCLRLKEAGFLRNPEEDYIHRSERETRPAKGRGIHNKKVQNSASGAKNKPKPTRSEAQWPTGSGLCQRCHASSLLPSSPLHPSHTGSPSASPCSPRTFARAGLPSSLVPCPKPRRLSDILLALGASAPSSLPPVPPDHA